MVVIVAGVAVMEAEEAEDTTTVEVVAGMIDVVGVSVIEAAAAVQATLRVAKLNFAVLWKISAPPLLGSRDRHSAFQNRLFVKSF
jgi:hypothetical protein